MGKSLMKRFRENWFWFAFGIFLITESILWHFNKDRSVNLLSSFALIGILLIMTGLVKMIIPEKNNNQETPSQKMETNASESNKTLACPTSNDLDEKKLENWADAHTELVTGFNSLLIAVVFGLFIVLSLILNVLLKHNLSEIFNNLSLTFGFAVLSIAYWALVYGVFYYYFKTLTYGFFFRECTKKLGMEKGYYEKILEKLGKSRNYFIRWAVTNSYKKSTFEEYEARRLNRTVILMILGCILIYFGVLAFGIY